MLADRSLVLVGIVASAALAACTVNGTISGGGASDPGADAGVVGGGGGGGTGSGSGSGSGSATGSGSGSGSGSNCVPVVAAASLTSGHHNAGMDCMQCHNGSTAPAFTLAGTLYTSTGSALAGGTITAVDAGGQTLTLVAQQNGNFYSSTTVTFPVTVNASACPTTTAMVSKVSAAGGCAASGCHTTGGQGPIHL